jgi:hypothetical protein
MDEVIWNLLRFNKWQDLSVSSAAQQSVHWTGGIRRHFRVFFPGQPARAVWLRVFPASKQSPRLPTCQ